MAYSTWLEADMRSVVIRRFFYQYIMAKSRQQKESAVAALEEKFKRAKAVVFTNFEGLSVGEADEMRSALREAGVDYMVAKRSLIGIALKKADLKDISIDTLTGGVGVAFGSGDEIAPAKTLATFGKKNEALKLVGGIFNGSFIDAAQVQQLASMPSKEELLVKLLWLIQYPTTGFVNVLAGTMRTFVYALQAIKDSKV